MENNPNWINEIEDTNNIMTPRFGHTLTLVNKTDENPKAVLFGGKKKNNNYLGATGAGGHFSINSDTFLYFIKTEKWGKLNGKIINKK